MLLIENGYVIDPASGRAEVADVLVDAGTIKRIAPSLRKELEEAGSKIDCLDAAGSVVAPGLVDIHVHFREPGFTYKEDISSGAAVAAKGGFTTVVLMANTKPPVDNVETLCYVLDKGRQTKIHVETCANVTKGMQGKELVPMEELLQKGAVGFTDDGVPILDEGIARRAMEEAYRLGVPLSFHEENPKYIKNNGINAGRAALHFGVDGSSRQAEVDMVERDLRLALETGACVNIQHISSKEAVELVRQAKKQGGNIHAEATPHHFTLTEEALMQYGTLAKMNPPLREESDRKAILEGLQDGTIDLIATDHAPHSGEEKAKPLAEAPSGILGLETALPLGITQLVDTGWLTLPQLLAKLTCNPADMYGLDAGYLAEGGPADILIFDAEAVETVGQSLSKSANTPFTGWRLTGVVKYTICNGSIVYEARKETGNEQKKDKSLDCVSGENCTRYL